MWSKENHPVWWREDVWWVTWFFFLLSHLSFSYVFFFPSSFSFFPSSFFFFQKVILHDNLWFRRNQTTENIRPNFLLALCLLLLSMFWCSCFFTFCVSLFGSVDSFSHVHTHYELSCCEPERLGLCNSSQVSSSGKMNRSLLSRFLSPCFSSRSRSETISETFKSVVACRVVRREREREREPRQREKGKVTPDKD